MPARLSIERQQIQRGGSGQKTLDPVYDEVPMPATLINGTKVAEDIKREVAAEVERLHRQ